MDDIIKKLSMQVDLEDFIPASGEEKAYMVAMRPSTTFLHDSVERLKKNRVAMVSFFVIVLITFMAIVIPEVWPYKYEEMLGYSPADPWMLPSITCGLSNIRLRNLSGSRREDRYFPICSERIHRGGIISYALSTVPEYR